MTSGSTRPGGITAGVGAGSVGRTARRPGRPQRGGRRPRPLPGTQRPDVIRALQRADLLPCINFIFSRAGCEAAVEQCLHAGLQLTTPAERLEIRERVLARFVDLPPSDLAVLGFDAWLDGLERGIAAHHAGLIPTFKEAVEELFQEGLVKVVFATETLALGINMPARAVVLERLVKWNGETHAPITPGEYTQLTGRAGRRGIDVEGHAVVVWHQGIDPGALAGLASTRTYPLISSFRPSYNMAVNLVDGLGKSAAREVLESSFAQFQADRGIVGLARQIQRNEEAIAGYEESMSCHLGDFAAYAAIRQEISAKEKGMARAGAAARRSEAAEALADLVPGDVIVVPTGRRAGVAVVIDPGLSLGEDPRPFVLTIDRQVRRLGTVDFPVPPQVLDRVQIPRSFSPRSANSRRELAALLRTRTDGMDIPKPGRRARAHDEDADLAQLRAQDAGAPVPRVCRPGAACAVGRAGPPPAHRDRGRAAPARGSDQLHRPAVRPHLRRAHGARLPVGAGRHPEGDRRGQAAQPDLRRVRPPGDAVPAAGPLGRAESRRAGRRVLRARVRVPGQLGARRRTPARAGGDPLDPRRDDADLGRP